MLFPYAYEESTCRGREQCPLVDFPQEPYRPGMVPYLISWFWQKKEHQLRSWSTVEHQRVIKFCPILSINTQYLKCKNMVWVELLLNQNNMHKTNFATKKIARFSLSSKYSIWSTNTVLEKVLFYIMTTEQIFSIGFVKNLSEVFWHCIKD